MKIIKANSDVKFSQVTSNTVHVYVDGKLTHVFEGNIFIQTKIVDNNYYTPTEAAKLLGFSSASVFTNAVRKSLVEGVKPVIVNGITKYHKSEIDNYVSR